MLDLLVFKSLDLELFDLMASPDNFLNLFRVSETLGQPKLWPCQFPVIIIFIKKCIPPWGNAL